MLAPTSVFDTKPNTYGIFRRYLYGRPSIFPTMPTISEVLNCPNFEQIDNSEKPPWWSVFGSSLKSVTKTIFGPFKNASTLLLLNWMHSGTNSKSNPEVDRLIHEVLRAPGFNIDDLTNFNAARECDRLDKYVDSGINPKDYLFQAQDGWIEGTAAIPLPCEGRKQKSEADAPKFEVKGILYRRPVEIIKAALNDPSIATYHWIPFKEFWRPSESSPPERIYSELYNSDAFIDAHARLQIGPRAIGPCLERVIVALMLWSDSTHLASFGNASLWPIYMYFGNQSKYVRGKATSYAAAHQAYIPKLSDTFQDFYRAVFGIPASSETITHCRRELIHLIWLLILDEDFMHAYVHGIEHVFSDGIRRLVFPRLFTYAADYPEKVLLACIKYLGNCPCSRCYVLKEKISDMGKKPDLRNRINNARFDDIDIHANIQLVRKWMFELGLPISNPFVIRKLGPQSLTPVRSAFSKRFFIHGINHYEMFVPDLLHEFELGVWKATFTHLLRILVANGGQGIQILNERYRQVPTFGRDTIRRFGANASGMKKLAARDYEDLLQASCALPVFDHLLPYEHHIIVQKLLFELCTWHALAKLRLHTESTIQALEHSTRQLGFALRDFKKNVCANYVTKDLPSEEAARGRRKAALTKRGGDNGDNVNQSTHVKTSKQERHFNISTYKLHVLADYPAAIRKYGTTDGFTSQVGEAQHKIAKRYYSRASKAEHTRSIARQQNLEADSNSRPQVKRKRANLALDAEREDLPCTDPNSHYHMASDTKNKFNIRQWPGDELEDDPACKGFLPRLLDHLLARLLGIAYDGDEATFPSAARSTVTICNNLIYSHQVVRVNYTTYDLRREQDTINIRTKPNIMLLSREDSPSEDGLQFHPYWYARVIGIFHAHVVHTGPQSKSTLPQRMDFLWVRWFGRDDDYLGWKSRQLLKIGFVDSETSGAFGFLDPALIIRGSFLEPAFAFGRTDELLPPSIARQPSEGDEDWKYYYVNMCVHGYTIV
ncbi:hypothetical protein M378DRAFT_90703 [Amanita muscaria Koide BX008]|uniref:Uncharacterized protein n=1 Tax=Amanita muscaria (strain Koide BX008) TaxID=946122 RepID=A0A0C2W3A3_AMAMK|nr:hypothetical protein M378DRAFT_90703 [Amanita muscaria Koide BX008]